MYVSAVLKSTTKRNGQYSALGSLAKTKLTIYCEAVSVSRTVLARTLMAPFVGSAWKKVVVLPSPIISNTRSLNGDWKDEKIHHFTPPESKNHKKKGKFDECVITNNNKTHSQVCQPSGL